MIMGIFFTIRLHSSFYHTISKLFNDSEIDPGYTYAIESSKFKHSKIVAHVTGMLYCYWYGKDTGRIHSRRYFQNWKTTKTSDWVFASFIKRILLHMSYIYRDTTIYDEWMTSKWRIIIIFFY